MAVSASAAAAVLAKVSQICHKAQLKNLERKNSGGEAYTALSMLSSKPHAIDACKASTSRDSCMVAARPDKIQNGPNVRVNYV